MNPQPFRRGYTKSKSNLSNESCDRGVKPCNCGLSKHGTVHETNDLQFYVMCDPCGRRIRRPMRTRHQAIEVWNRSKYLKKEYEKVISNSPN